MIWDDGGMSAIAIVATIFGFLVLPLAPSVIAGWICGRLMRGVSVAGGLTLGVFCGIVMIVLQPMMLAYIRWDLGVLINPSMDLVVAAISPRAAAITFWTLINPGMDLVVPVISASLCALVCYLWGRLVGRRRL